MRLEKALFRVNCVEAKHEHEILFFNHLLVSSVILV